MELWKDYYTSLGDVVFGLPGATVILADETQDKIQMTTVVGLVVKMGDLCYEDKEKFPKGPWCKEGEFVVYGRYSGSRFQTKYGEHRILNDDEIIGTIGKPEDILHLF